MTDFERAPLRTAHEWVRERLRHDILSGVHRPGAPLKQTELAARLRVSVTPVREAMRDLATEGLVVLDPQRVARVRDLDPNEASEVNDVRYLLEPLAASRAAAHATADDLARIQALAEECDAAATEVEWLDANRRFHLAIIESAHAPLLTGILGNLRQISAIYLAAAVRSTDGVREKSTREHLALASAIAAGDGPEAARLIRAHLFPTSVMAAVVADHRARESTEPASPAL